MSQYIPTYDSFANAENERYVPTERFQVLSSVYLPSSDIDLNTGMLKPDSCRRCRTQGKRMEIERLNEEEARIKSELKREITKGGRRISMRLGILIIALIVVVCGFYTLAQLGEIAQRQKEINRIERSSEDYTRKIADCETALKDASDITTICSRASKNLNMIPAHTAEAVHLTAAERRPLDKMTKQNNQQQAFSANEQQIPADVPAMVSGSN